MDILYPLGHGSTWGNNELKYSLRSVEKHVKEVDRVFIVGRNPKWITNIEYIEAKDDQGNKEKNIAYKIAKACQTDISDDFLFFNDDHIITQDISSNLPNYYSMTCQQMILRRNSGGEYRAAIENVRNLFGMEAKYFDIHTPIVYNKFKFLEMMERVDWTIKKGYIVKSLYGNMFNLEGTELLDFKQNKPQKKEFWEKIANERFCFSFGDQAVTPAFKYFLQQIFPEKSKYEI